MGQNLIINQEVAGTRTARAGQDEVGGVGENLGFATAAHDGLTAQKVADGGGGDGRSGPQCVYGDAGLAKFLGHAQDAHAHAVLRHRVGAMLGKPARFHVERRRQVQDVGILGLQKVRQTRLGAGEGASDVDLVHQVKSTQRRADGAGDADGRGVVHQNVDAAKGFDGLVHGSDDLVLVPDIDDAGKGLPARALDFLGGGVNGAGEFGMGLCGFGGDDDVGTVFCGPQRDGEADATAGPGDEKGFAS